MFKLIPCLTKLDIMLITIPGDPVCLAICSELCKTTAVRRGWKGQLSLINPIVITPKNVRSDKDYTEGNTHRAYLWCNSGNTKMRNKFHERTVQTGSISDRKLLSKIRLINELGKASSSCLCLKYFQSFVAKHYVWKKPRFFGKRSKWINSLTL